MKIYATRYQAQKAMIGSQAIVKVCAGGDKIGYVLMDYAQYRVWRKQR